MNFKLPPLSIKLNQEAAKFICSNYGLKSEGNMNIYQLALKFNVDSTTIRRVLVFNNIEIIPKHLSCSTFNKNQIEEMIQLYNAGKSSWYLGKKFKVTPTAIRRILVKNGVKMRKGSEASYRGAKSKTRDGYVYMTASPTEKHLDPNGKSHAIAEHRLVMARHLGRPLLKSESVHHINGVRDDNRIENLELWSKSQPYGQRIEDKVRWAKELLDFYCYKEGNLIK